MRLVREPRLTQPDMGVDRRRERVRAVLHARHVDGLSSERHLELDAAAVSRHARQRRWLAVDSEPRP